MSMGKKIVLGILLVALLGMGAAGSAAYLWCRTGGLLEDSTAAGKALRVVDEGRLRLATDGAGGLPTLRAGLAEARDGGLSPEVADTVGALVERAERWAATGNLAEARACLDQAAEALGRETEQTLGELAGQARNGSRLAAVFGLLALGAGLALSLLLSRNIVGPLYQVINGLNEGAAQTAAASNQVASSAQEVARGATEQAASLEETSAAMEELGAMVKQNAGNAAKADQLVGQADGLTRQAREVMRQTTQAMEGITAASEEAAKVVKTIDEIAFQTNLLALNAAVEAARAGEAGMGFAVVADEVRSLAQRSANAARDTTQLINATLTRIREGQALVQRVDEAYREVAVASRQVATLVNEIAAASQEQSLGVEQINIAVTQMDRVTQGNAASAEQSASASEQLTAQAAAIQKIVADLGSVIGQGTARGRKEPGLKPVAATRPLPAAVARATRPRPSAPAPRPVASPPPGRPRTPEEIIPFNERSFEDF